MDRRAERQERAKRLKSARLKVGFPSTRIAAHTCGWNVETYRAHESGRNGFDVDYGRQYARRFGVALPWLMYGEDAPETRRNRIPIMGYVGAGAEIAPEFEQVPPEGLEQVELPVQFAEEMIGFQVRGDSMMPTYQEDWVIVVPAEQPTATESLVGEVCAVRTEEGGRFLKRLMRGSRRHRYNLESIDARTRTIEDVGVLWASPVRAIIPNGGRRRLARKARAGRPAKTERPAKRR